MKLNNKAHNILCGLKIGHISNLEITEGATAPPAPPVSWGLAEADDCRIQVALLHDMRGTMTVTESSGFGPRVYQRGSIVIALVRWSTVVRPWSALDISETINWFFQFFLHEVRTP